MLLLDFLFDEHSKVAMEGRIGLPDLVRHTMEVDGMEPS